MSKTSDDSQSIRVTGYVVVDKVEGRVALPLYQTKKVTTLNKLNVYRKFLINHWSKRFNKEMEILFVYEEINTT